MMHGQENIKLTTYLRRNSEEGWWFCSSRILL